MYWGTATFNTRIDNFQYYVDTTPPTANAGPDQTVNQGSIVTFDGSGSTDDVGITNYSWNFTDGTGQSLFGVGPSYLFSNAGTFPVTLTCMDAAGNVGTDTMTVTVNAYTDTTPPVVNAGPDQTVNISEAVTFDGSGSTDDVAISNYWWNFTDGTSKTLLGVNPTYVFGNVSAYAVLLTCRDTAGNKASDSVTITVIDATAPVANAGPDQAVPEDTIVNFDGSLSTDNVGITNYWWNFTHNATSESLTTVNPSFTFWTPGVYPVDLTVMDGAGLTSSDQVVITVADITAPVANAGPDQTVNQGATVNFDGSGSIDNVGIANYTWTFNDGGPITLYNLAPSYIFLTSGIYPVLLTVSDSAGNVDTDTMIVTVNDTTAPVANAGPDQTVPEDTLVNFDGSLSTDNVGITNYWWNFTHNATSESLTTVNPSFTFWTPGVYPVDLTVTDGAGLTDSDQVVITVADVTAPVANAGPDQTVNQGAIVTFDGSGSIDNVGIINYWWNFTDVTPQSLTGTGPSYLFGNAGAFVVDLACMDAAGNVGTDSMMVTVNAFTDTMSPNASAGLDQTVIQGAVVTFNGSGSDDNVAITNYSWTFFDGVNKTIYGVNPSYAFQNVSVYTVTLTCLDAAGNSDNDTVNITVNPDATPPVANAGLDQTVPEDVAMAFDGSLSSDNAGIVNYSWSFLDTVMVNLYGSSPSYTFAQPGTYVATLIVYDLANNTDADTVVITVADATAPTANAGPDQFVDEDTIVTLNASASLDNVGITSYWWNFTDGAPMSLTTEVATHMFSTPGIFTVTLTVMDAAGNTATDTATVTVNDTTAPVADAGADQTIVEGNNATFNGTGSTDNVGVVNYTWTFTDGVPVVLYGVAPLHLFMTPGVYPVLLTVSDLAGNADNDTMTVTVNDMTVPVANAGPDQGVPQGTKVFFNGSLSTDDVIIISSWWNFTDGTNQTLIGLTANYTFANAGVFPVVLTVMDEDGKKNSDTMVVTVFDTSKPVANAGADIMVDEDMPALFDGSLSTDNVGVSIYTWTFVDNGTVQVFGISPGYTFATPGIYVVTLNATDAAGNWDTDTMMVTVADVTPPVANAGLDVTMDEDNIVIFNGSGSTDNMLIMNYTWTFIDGTLVVLYDISPVYYFTTPGVFNVTLMVTDIAWNIDTDYVSITVNDVTPPVADAGEDIVVEIGSVVHFNGTSSSDNVGVANYTWTFTDGTPQVLFGATPSHTFSSVGTFVVTLTVLDEAGNANATSINVVVQLTADLTNPVANAGPDQIVNEDTLVVFDGSASNDDSGTIAGYSWGFSYNGTSASISGVSPSFTFWTPGTYLVTLTVADSAGNAGTDTMTVLVKDTTPPAPDAGLDRTVNEDSPVSLDGSGTTDNNGTAGLSYTWTFTDGSTRTLTGILQTYTFTTPGTYTVTLTVSDASGNTATDEAVLTVADVTPPAANAGPDQTVDEDAGAAFNGGASTDNVGIVQYLWTINDEARVGVSTSYIFTEPGSYLVTLEVLDAGGNSATDTLIVTVNDITAPIAEAGLGQSVDEGDTVIFNGSGSSDNVGVDNYTWTFNCQGARQLYGVSPSFTFSLPGIYTVTLMVHDVAGNSGTDTLSVTVRDTTPPLANASMDQSVLTGAMVTFNGSGSSDNVAIASWMWAFTYDGAPVSLGGVNASHTFSIPGVYMVTLTVTDAAGLSDTDTMNVTVVTPNRAPVADAGADQTVEVGDNVTFSASASLDLDGDVLNYTWTFTHDGATVTLYGMTPVFVFEVAGPYNVTLTVSDGKGGADTDFVNITVEEEEVLPTPEAEEEEEEDSRCWLWILLILLVIVIAAAVIYFVLYQKKKDGEDAQEADGASAGGESGQGADADGQTEGEGQEMAGEGEPSGESPEGEGQVSSEEGESTEESGGGDGQESTEDGEVPEPPTDEESN